MQHGMNLSATLMLCAKLRRLPWKWPEEVLTCVVLQQGQHKAVAVKGTSAAAKTQLSFSCILSYSKTTFSRSSQELCPEILELHCARHAQRAASNTQPPHMYIAPLALGLIHIYFVQFIAKLWL